jgi:small subunit ribosomal protein S21|tara:strand:+ start:404 stop:664 length:261 start_codon:yes stop_codon:yes gene_type:complete
MAYNKGKNKFHKKRKRIQDPPGLSVSVVNNNVEFALKRLKKKVKESDLFLELKKRTFYEKPSKIKREKRNLAILRNSYKNEKEDKN